MLGILLIFFIGRYFYNLALKYDKNAWLYAIIGVVTYYGSGLVVGFAIAILALVFEWEDILDEGNTLLLNLLSIPVGILGCYIVYYFLEKNFKGQTKDHNPNTLDEELFQ